MNYRPLGETGLLISEIGFGCWGIGGDTYGATDDTVSLMALHAALDLGINFFDSADLYGQGKSESLLGEALQGRRSNAVIATKVGSVGSLETQDFSAKHVRSAIAGSLKRLRTDHIDLYQLHNPPLEVFEQNRDLLETLEDLKAQGKIRVYGVSVRGPSDAAVFIKKHGLKSVQVNFNLMDQRIKDLGLLELAQDHGAGLIARTPLCFGFLSGMYGATGFSPQDHRSSWSEAQRQRWVSGIGKFLPADGSMGSKAQFALRFCLSHLAISTAIPGMLTPEQVSENVAASGQKLLSAEELEACFEIFKRNEFFIRKSE